MDFGYPLNAILPKLQKTVMICPFHEEQTPSMILHWDIRKAYCFGCQKEYSFSDVAIKVLENKDKGERR